MYTIEPGSDKSAGAARFASKLKSFKAENPLVLFSGDAFNPSAMSTITKGKHMVPVLNDLGTHVACMGNHGAHHLARRARARAASGPPRTRRARS